MHINPNKIPKHWHFCEKFAQKRPGCSNTDETQGYLPYWEDPNSHSWQKELVAGGPLVWCCSLLKWFRATAMRDGIVGNGKRVGIFQPPKECATDGWKSFSMLFYHILPKVFSLAAQFRIKSHNCLSHKYIAYSLMAYYILIMCKDENENFQSFWLIPLTNVLGIVVLLVTH